MQEYSGRRIARIMEHEAVAALRRVVFQNRPEWFERARTCFGERENPVEVALDAQTEQRSGPLDEASHVTGKQAAKLLARDDRALGVEPRGDFAAIAIELALPFFESLDLLGRKLPLDFGHTLCGALVGDRLFEIVLEAHSLKQPADNVENLVGVEFLADFLELVEQRLEYAAFAGAARHQVDDAHLVGLFVAMDTAHALLQPRRIPWDVVVDHQPAGALQVDAFPRGVGADHISRAAVNGWLVEEGYLFLTLQVVHRAVNSGDAAGKAHRFETLDDEVQGIAVLGEDEDLLIAPSRVSNYFAEFLELGVFAALVDLAREIQQIAHLVALGLKLAESGADHARHRLELGGLVFLEPIFGLLFVGGLVIFDIAHAQAFLKRQQLLSGEAAGSHVLD